VRRAEGGARDRGRTDRDGGGRPADLRLVPGQPALAGAALTVTVPPPARAPAADDEALGRLRYLPLERLRVRRPVDRIAYVRERCRGLRVLDLGAYDETEVVKRQHGSWRWLHREIPAVAREGPGGHAAPQLAGAPGATTP